MTSSMTPSARRPSPGPSFERRSRRGWQSPIARSASRTTTGWAQLPPTHPSIVPSGWMMPDAPGRAEVGFRTATTVATANDRPAASSSAARTKVDREVMRLRDALLVQDGPDLLWRDRDVDVAHPEMPQRIDHGVGDRRRGADRRRLPHSLRSDRVMRRGCDRLAGLPGGTLDGGRDEVVHERPGHVVAELVVGDLFVERRREAHVQAAVDLTVDDHRVDDVAAVVDRHETTYVDLARALVDVDDTDVASEREGQVRRIVVVDCLEPHLHPLREVRVGREGDLLDRLEPVGRALDAELAGLPFEIVLGRLEQVGGELACLGLDLARGHRCRGAGSRRRARPICPEPVRRRVGVAVLDLDVPDREAELLGDDLGVRRLVALSLRLRRDLGMNLARRVDADEDAVVHLEPDDVEVVRGAGADDLGEAADADAHELAALALLSLLAAKPGVVDGIHRLLQGRRVVARVVRPAGRRLVRELLGLDEVLHP